MEEYIQFRLAAVQAAPVYFDRDASTEKACGLIREAGERGATLAAFGESWLPGYPFFVWGSATGSMAAEYLANAVEIPSAATDRVCEAARQANIDVVIGVAERDAQTRGTVYCTLLFIGSDGTILGRHRKLKPTNRERTAWGEGDGSSLTVYDRPYAKISGLNCWEHNMVLPGYALMSQGTQIHIAAWPGMSASRHTYLSRAFASQAGAYVIDVGGLLSPDHVPEAYKRLADSYPGESCIVDPRGEVIAGPAEGESIVTADCSMKQIYSAKSLCDVAGHYSRPDVFRLSVNKTPHRRVVEMQEQESETAESEEVSEE
ncbi:MAG: carbon-nitrogen hydrolase family protein [Deltaproteobacteria bacterium]|nr:carbon-nitrogen hydrolase family protein [Deltaproteobacteria bacterium]